MQDASSIIQRFSRKTGIVDKDVNLLIDGLENCPSKRFLHTPGGSDPVYFAIDYATVVKEERQKTYEEVFKERCFGTWPSWEEERAIAINEKPRGIGVMKGIKPI